MKIKEAIKDYCEEKGIACEDFGVYTEAPADYPDIAKAVAESVVSGKSYRGVLTCGTGIGVCIAANKVRGIRAALCHDERYAEMARKHNDANVLCLGGRILGRDEALKIFRVFIETDFEGGRHVKRLGKISDMESKYSG